MFDAEVFGQAQGIDTQGPLHPVYLWARPWRPKVAWDRQLGGDLDVAELASLRAAEKWQTQFVRAAQGQRLDPLECYVVPTKMGARLRGALVDSGRVPIGYSALLNTPVATGLATFADSARVPEVPSLARLEGRKRLHAGAGVRPVAALEVEAWTRLEPLEAYRETRLGGPGALEKLVADEVGLTAAQVPVATFPHTSAPPMSVGAGGILQAGLVGTLGADTVRAYHDAWARMVPPPLRTDIMPAMLANGAWRDVQSSVQMRFSDTRLRSAHETHALLLGHANALPALVRPLVGEVSAQALLRAPEGNSNLVRHAFLEDVSRTDLFRPDFGDEIASLEGWSNLARAIDGRVHGEIARRHLALPNPAQLRDGLTPVIEGLATSFADHLEGVVRWTAPQRVRLASSLASKSLPTLARLSAASARAQQRKNIEAADVKIARGLVLDGFAQVFNAMQSDGREFQMGRMQRSQRGLMILEVLGGNPGGLAAGGLLEALGAEFDDAADLLTVLGAMEREGSIYRDTAQRYRSVDA